MVLKLVIAQELDVDFILFNEELYSIMYPIGDYFVIFRENATCSDSIGRWDMIFRHKDNLSQFLKKDDPADQRFPSMDDFTEEQYLNGVKDIKIFFNQLGTMENDIIIGYAEVTPISQEKCLFILYLKEVINKSFADPIFEAINNFIAPPRRIINKIDPKLSISLKETIIENQDVDNEEAAEEKRVEVTAYPYDGLNKSLFPNEEIEPHDFKGQGKFDDIYIHFYIKKKYTAIMISRLLKKKEIYRTPDTIYNRISKLRKMHGEEIIPSKITKHN